MKTIIKQLYFIIGMLLVYELLLGGILGALL